MWRLRRCTAVEANLLATLEDDPMETDNPRAEKTQAPWTEPEPRPTDSSTNAPPNSAASRPSVTTPRNFSTKEPTSPTSE